LNQEPSPEDKEELEAFYARTLERIEKAAAMLMSREPRLAEEFIREKEQINVESRRSRTTRLERPLSVQSASSNVVDMINCLRRIVARERGGSGGEALIPGTRKRKSSRHAPNGR
jgi:Na+/phosphate symporter